MDCTRARQRKSRPWSCWNFNISWARRGRCCQRRVSCSKLDYNFFDGRKRGQLPIRTAEPSQPNEPSVQRVRSTTRPEQITYGTKHGNEGRCRRSQQHLHRRRRSTHLSTVAYNQWPWKPWKVYIRRSYINVGLLPGSLRAGQLILTHLLSTARRDS